MRIQNHSFNLLSPSRNFIRSFEIAHQKFARKIHLPISTINDKHASHRLFLCFHMFFLIEVLSWKLFLIIIGREIVVYDFYMQSSYPADTFSVWVLCVLCTWWRRYNDDVDDDDEGKNEQQWQLTWELRERVKYGSIWRAPKIGLSRRTIGTVYMNDIRLLSCCERWSP